MENNFVSAIIKELERTEKIQSKCPHKKVELFDYMGKEYPSGGYRCVKCGYATQLFKTIEELNKEKNK